MTSPTDTSHEQLADRNLSLDAEGFLKHLSDWDESVATLLAGNENIKLEEAQWEVIHMLRASDWYSLRCLRCLQQIWSRRWDPEGQ